MLQNNSVSKKYFSARFGETHFYVLKEKFSMNFPQYTSKQQKGIV